MRPIGPDVSEDPSSSHAPSVVNGPSLTGLPFYGVKTRTETSLRFRCASQDRRAMIDDRGLSITTYISCDACPALRHRMVLLKPTVLEEVLEHVRPVPIELHLLHRNSSPLIPKSCVGLRLEVPAGPLVPRTRTALLADDGHAAVGFSPRSVKALAAIGCYHSPLDVTYSETSRNISLATTLTLNVDDASDSFEDEPKDDFDSETEFSQEDTSLAYQQVIELSISLGSYTPSTPKRPPSLAAEKQPPEEDTKACFSVANFIHIPYDEPPPLNLYDSELANLNGTASMRRFEAPCVDGSDGTRTYTFNTGGTLQRIVAQADFIVPASLDRERDRFNVRLLRLALELPHPGARSDNDVWLSIDLSDIFEKPTDNARPSSAVPAGNSMRPSGVTVTQFSVGFIFSCFSHKSQIMTSSLCRTGRHFVQVRNVSRHQNLSLYRASSV